MRKFNCLGGILKMTILSLLLFSGVFYLSAQEQAHSSYENVEYYDVDTMFLDEAPPSQIDITNTSKIVKDKPFDEIPSMDKLIETYNYWYGLAVALLGYFSYIIPGIKNWENIGARLLAIGFVLGALFLSFGFADIWQVIISFLVTTIGYDKILSVFLKTPK